LPFQSSVDMRLPQNAHMTERQAANQLTAAVRLQPLDRPDVLAAIAAAVAAAGGTMRMLSTVRRLAESPPTVEVELEVDGITQEALTNAVESVADVREVHATRSLERVYGKRIIVVGGGAQVAQVALGAVSEADRHNLRGERISVDTIPLVGEEALAAAVRGVADLPRARCLVLAGSLMGGDVTRAVRELRERGVPVIALNMAGSVPDAADLVVSDPVQAGTMAVMAIADTASFDLARQRGRRY
jgi:energy-converting hydrogenase B subunit Q